jgi:hypothetical protein
MEEITEPITEQTIEAITEQTIEPITEPTIEPITEPTIEPITEPTIEPITEPITEPRKPKQRASKSPGENNECVNICHLMLLRNIRNNYLNLTDKYLLPDYPITFEQKEIIKVYRQMLRDFININKEDILNGITNIEIPPIPI